MACGKSAQPDRRGQRLACATRRVSELPTHAPTSRSSAADSRVSRPHGRLPGAGCTTLVLEREATLGRFASGRGAGLGRQLAEDDATTDADGARRSAAPRAAGGVDADRRRARLRRRGARGGLRGARRAARRVAVERSIATAVLAYWPALDGLPIAGGAVRAERRRDRRRSAARPASPACTRRASTPASSRIERRARRCTTDARRDRGARRRRRRVRGPAR